LNLALHFLGMRLSMTKQIELIAFVVSIARLLPICTIFFFDAPTAQAKQCSAAMPSNRQGHWSYRFVDGRKCWYQGKNMLSKSLLHWPAQAPGRPVSDGGRVSVVTKKSNDLFDPDVCCWPALDEADSFEARWRGVEMN
jgi:hypothetical protein